MALTSFDGAIAGMQWPRMFAKVLTGTLVIGRPQTLWALAGIPGTGSYDTTLNGVTLSGTSAQVNGQVNFVDSGSSTYLARFQGQTSGSASILLLCDRLWHNGGFSIVSTGAQNITSPTWPARDADGATAGNGVMLALEISATVAGIVAPTITIAYTNQAGTSGRSTTNLDATTNNPATGATYRIGLQAGDTGVQSVQSLTLSTTWVTGTMNLVAYRIIAMLELTAADVPNSLDLLTSGFTRMYNGSVPYFMLIPTATTTSKVHGSLIWTRG